MDMLQQIIQLVTILFLLSMVCERIADFLKHYLCGSEFFGIGDTVTKFSNESIEEQARTYRILKINVWCGIITAAILKADLIKIFNNIQSPGDTIGWNNITEYKAIDYVFLIPGIVLTGLFISFGSKFWHDLLDILYEVKNTKRVLSDPETYKVDNVNSLQRLFSTYQSDFIKAAYLEAKSKYMAIDSVKAIAIKSNDLGYYFELTVVYNDPSIGQYYQYLLDDGTPQNIPIKIVVLADNDKIIAQAIDLSSQVFDINHSTDYGTAGVLVKDISDPNKPYLLTCCHNVINPITNLPYNSVTGKKVNAATLDGNEIVELGSVYLATRDHEIDAALIEIKPQLMSNYIPSTGIPQKPRELLNSDRNKLKGRMYGAKSKATSGLVTSIYNDIKITYENADEFTITDTIAISNNGVALSQSGDSGSCIVDDDRNVIGLVVAGNSTTTYLISIIKLLSKLKVELV